MVTELFILLHFAEKLSLDFRRSDTVVILGNIENAFINIRYKLTIINKIIQKHMHYINQV